MSFLDNIQQRKAGGTSTGSSFLDILRENREKMEQQPKKTPVRAEPKPITPSQPIPPSFRELEDKSMQSFNAINNNPFISVQKTIYDNTLGPVQDFFNRVANKASNELTFGISNKGLENSNLAPLDFKQTLNPAQTTSEKVADVTGLLAGSLAPISGAYATGGKLAAKGLSRVAPNAGKLTQSLIRGTGAGLAYGTAKEAIEAGFDTRSDGEQTLGERAKNVGIDAALFGGGDAAFGLAGKAIQATPLYKNFQLSREINKLQPQSKGIQSFNRPAVVSEGVSPVTPLTRLDDSFGAEFKQSIDDQYKILKNDLDNLGGVEQGKVFRDDFGDVIGRQGRSSNNPVWYQEFYRVNGRRPNDQELRQLAEEQIRKGYTDTTAKVPSWEPQVIQELDDEIRNIRQMMDETPDPTVRNSLEQTLKELQSEYNTLSGQFTKQLDNNFTPKETLSIGKLDIELPKQKTEISTSAPQKVDVVKELNDILGNKIKVANNNVAVGKANVIPVNKSPKPSKPVTVDPTKNYRELIKQQISYEGKQPKNKWSFDKAYAAVVDDLHAINKATKELGGKGVTDAYKQARLAKGVPGKAETLLRGGIYKDGQKVGKSLQEIIKPFEKNIEDLIEYSVAKRALDYDAKGLTAGIKPKGVDISDKEVALGVIKQFEKSGNKAALEQAHKELIEFSTHLLDDLVESGVLSKKSVESMRKENPNYIPMFRVQDPKVRGFDPLKKAYANLGDPIKKRTGSEKPIVNPIENIIKNVYQMTNISERNKVGRSLLELTEKTPDNVWARVVGKNKGMDLDDLTKVLNDAEITADGNSKAIDQLFKGEGNKVYVFKDGQRVEMELQEDLYRAMLSLDAQKNNFFINLLSYPTQTLRAGAVLSPDFGPVNIIRDQFSAFVNSKYGFIPFWDMFKGLSHVLKKDDMYWNWKGSGGANGILSGLDREYLQQDLRKMVKQSWGRKVKNAAKSPLQTLLSPLRKASEISEEATRLGEFMKGIKKGASFEDAAFSSRDLIDFNRAGYLGRDYNKITAFFNAAVQSVDKASRTFKENPAGASVRAALSITLPSMALYAMNHDQEWYKDIPQRERDLFWHFKPPGTDQIIKIPKPFELGVLFGTTVERSLELAKTQDPESFKGFAKTFADAFTPNWIPTALLPWIEVYANQSTYFDSPIVPRREENLLPQDQYSPYTSELAKGVGKMAEVSPRKADHVISGYTGGLGKYALKIGDYATELLGNNRPAMPDRGVADWPVLNRFVVKNLEGNNQNVNDFYETLDKLTKERKSAQKNNINYQDEGLYKFFTKINRDISELQSEKRDILENLNLDGKQKNEEIRRIDKLITDLSKKALERK